MSFAERFKAEGWLQVDGIFPLALIDELRDEFERQFTSLAAREDQEREYLRVGDERVMLSVALKGPFLDPRLYAQPVLLKILRHFLAEDLLIDSLTCVVALPGAGEQHAHRDHGELFHDDPDLNGQLPPYAVTVAVPLIDLSPETGTTKLLPGTHRGEQILEPALPYLARGSCFLMDYRIEHYGTANHSAARRPVLYCVFARPWFTDIRNFRRQPRINIDRADLQRIPAEHWPLFRRVAAKGAIDLAEKELFAVQ